MRLGRSPVSMSQSLVVGICPSRPALFIFDRQFRYIHSLSLRPQDWTATMFVSNRLLGNVAAAHERDPFSAMASRLLNVVSLCERPTSDRITHD
jgi:hypothetical protein